MKEVHFFLYCYPRKTPATKNKRLNNDYILILAIQSIVNLWGPEKNTQKQQQQNRTTSQDTSQDITSKEGTHFLSGFMCCTI